MCTDPVSYLLISGLISVLGIITFHICLQPNPQTRHQFPLLCVRVSSRYWRSRSHRKKSRVWSCWTSGSRGVAYRYTREEGKSERQQSSDRGWGGRGEEKDTSSEREGNCTTTMIREVQIVSLYSKYVHLFDFDRHGVVQGELEQAYRRGFRRYRCALVTRAPKFGSQWGCVKICELYLRSYTNIIGPTFLHCQEVRIKILDPYLKLLHWLSASWSFRLCLILDTNAWSTYDREISSYTCHWGSAIVDDRQIRSGGDYWNMTNQRCY